MLWIWLTRNDDVVMNYTSLSLLFTSHLVSEKAAQFCTRLLALAYVPNFPFLNLQSVVSLSVVAGRKKNPHLG